MKKLFVPILLGVLLTTSLGTAKTDCRISVASLAGNVGLAMVKLMDEPFVSGCDINFEVLKSPDLAVGKLIAGEADFAGLPLSTAAVMYNKGAGIQTAAIIGWGVMYIVSDDASIKKWADLKGKEVYVSAKGAISDILLRYLIIKNKLIPGVDVSIQYIAGSVELAQMVASGKVTLAAMPEPWVSGVLEKNPKVKIVLDYQKEWQRIEKQGSTYPQTCIVVRRQFARDHPEALRGFLNALRHSIGWVRRHPKEAGILAEKYVQIASPAVEQGLERMNLRYDNAVDVRSAIDRFLRRLVIFEPDSVGGKMPDEGFYYQP